MNFADPISEPKAVAKTDVICRLTHDALIAVIGSDSQAFLQAQLCNDVAQVSIQHTQLSAYCSPKGRMLGMFRLIEYGEGFLLLMRAANRDTVLERLQIYVMRSNVTLTPDDDVLALGLSGPGVTEQLRQTVGSVPQAVNDCLAAEPLRVVRVPGHHAPRFEIIGPRTPVDELWDSLRGHMHPVSTGYWSWLDIRMGIPTVLPQTVDRFVPQMANLDLIGGVSFHKGCYPGQEIIARVQHLGKLKQRMMLGHVNQVDTVTAGDRVFASDGGEQSVGTVVDSQAGPDGGHDLLAVVQLRNIQAGALSLKHPNGPPIAIGTLPYHWEDTPAREDSTAPGASIT